MKKIKRIFTTIFKYLSALVVSLLLALVIRLFMCNFYSVPGDSMEPAIVPGDFILANKWLYGARIFTGLKLNNQGEPPMIHAPGFVQIKRNDVIVFNYPYHHHWDTIRMNLEKIFVKRCIALPGDQISSVGGFYHVTGLADTLGCISEQKRMVQNRFLIDSVIIRAFAFDESFGWDVFDFGPFYVPAKGATIALTGDNFKLYHKLITYETEATVCMDDSLIYINDTVSLDYTFRYNWYFMAGDNVANSQDSRYLGLIPETFIIGKATRVITSKDKNAGKRRWRRTLKRIN